MSVDVVELCQKHGLVVVPDGSRWSTLNGHVTISYFNASSGPSSMWGVRIGNSFVSHFDLELALKKALGLTN